MLTEADIAISAAAERIAIAASDAVAVDGVDPEVIADLCVIVSAEATRVAAVELRRIADDTYALGVSHATPDTPATDAPTYCAAGYDAVCPTASADYGHGYHAGYTAGIRYAEMAIRPLVSFPCQGANRDHGTIHNALDRLLAGVSVNRE